MTTIAMTALIGLILICIFNTAALVYTVSKFRKAHGSNASQETSSQAHYETAPAPQPVRYPAPEINEEELAQARKKFQADMDAFQELMNYNQNKAYGIETGLEE